MRKNQHLIYEYQDVGEVDSLEKYKEQFLECRFWADGYSIKELEKILNIKLVIFSNNRFIRGDLDNVIQCGEIADYDLTKGPIYYILADYTDDIHYKLIKFKSSNENDFKGLFLFDELPNQVIEKIKKQCLQKRSGAFYVIPQFKALIDSKKNVSD